MSKLFYNTISFMLLISIIICGAYTTNYLTKKIRTDEVSNLLIRSEMAALSVQSPETSKLVGDISDMDTEVYKQKLSKLRQIRSINTDTRFVYLMGQKGNEQFFMIDSEPATSKDYSPVGQVYTDATAEDIESFRKNKPFTKGHYADRWGEWFTAYAPLERVKSSTTPEYVYIGLDISAQKILLREKIVGLASMLVFGLLFLATLSTLILVRKKI